MAARSKAEIKSLLVYKSPTRKGGALYSTFRNISDHFVISPTHLMPSLPLFVTCASLVQLQLLSIASERYFLE